MCGIFVVFAKRGCLPTDVESRLAAALKAIEHRGPDSSGIYIDTSRRFALGHVRLSVIDTQDRSSQPMFSPERCEAIVFNGEIYNYESLRGRGDLRTVHFKTNSDTEVLLHLLSKCGDTCLSFLNGMWAFAWADLKNLRFIVSRDRFGVKPLYCYEDNSILIYASEAKAILAYLGRKLAVNLNSIGNYIKYGIGGESRETWFDGVTRVPAGTYINIQYKGDALDVSANLPYYHYPTEVAGNEAYLYGEFEALLCDAVKLRLRSDVPVAISLSGGLDSSAISAICSRSLGVNLRAYTAFFEPEYKSELPNARKVASLHNHRLIPVLLDQNPTVVQQVLRKAVYHLEYAHSSTALVPYFLLCQRASQDVVVMLEGQGADESLAGYDIFSVFLLAEKIRKLKIKQAGFVLFELLRERSIRFLLGNLARFLFAELYKAQHLKWGSRSILSCKLMQSEPEALIGVKSAKDVFYSALLHSHKNGLQNLLSYGDAISMAHSLEARLPFMDYRLVNLLFSTVADFKIAEGFRKYPLRRAVADILPSEIVWDKTKRGFSNPVASVLIGAAAIANEDKRIKEKAIDLGIFSGDGLKRSLEHLLPDHIYYRIYGTLLWAEQFA